ncbi:MAG: serine/threonine-protein kinase, partial [Phycisphaerales bacterium JB061]
MSSAPTTVGPYEILGEIGRGGMGIVYRATDRRLGRDVAIKALPDQVAHDPDRLERFQREARSLAQINHPNIAGIFGVEEQDGRHYLVLEFVDGATLSERLDAGALPIEDTIQVGTQIASAIEAAHDAGIVHRDLKPDNIKVTPEGRIKVLDFGLAKTENTSALSTGNTETASIRQDATAPGVILGTAAYMSPEQVRGRHIDKRTDLWAFGVIIYEMLTGIGPFRGDTATDSIGAVLHKEIDYELLPKTTPAPLIRLIQRCLTRDREHRLRDAGDARLELEEALHAPAESPAHKHTSARSWWLPLAVCVLAVAAVGWRYWNTPVTETPLVRSSLIAPEGMAMTRPKLSPDGQHIAAIGFPREYGQLGTPTIDSLLYRSLDEAEFKAAPIAGVEFFDFSPDSASIAFAARGEEISETLRLYRMPADGSAAPTQIMSIPSEFRPSGRRWFSWLPSNEFVFLDKAVPRLVLYSADTGKQTRDIPISSDDPDLDLGSIT